MSTLNALAIFNRKLFYVLNKFRDFLTNFLDKNHAYKATTKIIRLLLLYDYIV